MNHPSVDTIYGEPELDLLGANHPNWGRSVITLKEDYWFSDGRPLVSYHGAWFENERHLPLILSGAGIRAGARLETCETIDLAPTLSLLLGGDVPRHADGRVLWEVLDAERAPSVENYTRLIHAREELLSAWKRVKREHAEQTIPREEYLAREAELKRASAANIAARKAEGERLRERERVDG